MPRTHDPFAALTGRYEQWFEHHRGAYVSELLAIRSLLPVAGHGVEVGVGSGRFAAPLGVAVGVDVSEAMVRVARDRGIAAAIGRAEALPFRDAVFDYALVVTTICFVEDPVAMLGEARRVLRAGGHLLIAAVDRDSELGARYLQTQASNPFYRHATFYSSDEIQRLLLAAGFSEVCWVQTLPGGLQRGDAVQPVAAGRGSGAFVVVRSRR